MLISYSRQFIFFHVAKVAGLSIRDALQPYAQDPDKFKIKRPPRTLAGEPNPLYDMWSILLLHAKAREAKKELSEDIYNTFYKFAFVRNPWDWQVSMYHFILQEPSHVRHQLVKSMASFEDYLDWVVDTKNPYARGASKFQKDMVTDGEGNLIVDFVGRFETLEQDFHHICQVLNLEASLPHINRTSHRNFQDYYTERTRQLLGNHFKDDIELFGYTFDGYDPESKYVGSVPGRK